VVPLDICGIVLGSPYLYDRKAIFFREENMYHLIKDGIEYIVRAHHMKSDLSLVTTGQLKRIVNASKNVSLMSAKEIEGCDLECNNEIVKFVPSYEVFQDSPKLPHEDSLYASIRDHVKKNRGVVNSFSVASMCSLLLLMCCAWLVVEMLNASSCERKRMIDYVSNIISTFILVIQFL
jgi:hypothetical protein